MIVTRGFLSRRTEAIAAQSGIVLELSRGYHLPAATGEGRRFVSVWETGRRIPWSLVLCAVGLMAVGVSAIARGDSLAGGTKFVERQFVWIVLVIPVLAVSTSINYRLLARYSYALFGLAILLLCLVYLFRPINGARRWIPMGFFSFQPSEVAKLTFILALASYLRFRENYRQLTGLLIPFALTLVPLGLILKEPNLGTALLFLPVLYAMLFAAGARPRHLISVALLGVLVLPLLWLGMSAEQKSRVTALFLQTDGGPTPTGDNYHLHQSKQVLALGGVWGSQLSGETLDDLYAYHLPEGRTDFVFCLVGERWGLIGCLTTLTLYCLLFAKGLLIAAATREPFGRLLAVGIVALLATQTAINTGMTVGLMPITGITLPLMSYGGSSLLATCFALGLLVNVSLRRGYELAGEPFRFVEA